ncbi:sulfotransferase family [Fragilaria crotonensis]|nr:sulfotransferase family [Fragilaria crotonensis]
MIASLKWPAAAIAVVLCCAVPFSNANPYVRNPTSKIPVVQDDRIFNNMIDSSPVVIESHKLIFFPVPKVADTLWLMLFRRMMGIENWQLLDDDPFEGLMRLSDYSVEEATEMMNSPEYTRATFVRDPKDRFLSTFVDKMMSGDASIQQSCCPEGENCLHEHQTMTDFASLIQTCDNKYWMPVSNWIDKKFIPTLDFVGHFESAQEDAKFLLDAIGAWELFGQSGWGKDGDEAMFASNDPALTDATAKDMSGSWDLLSKLMTPRIESILEKFYGEDYSVHEFGLKIKKVPFSVEPLSFLRFNKGKTSKKPFTSIHIVMFETDETESMDEDSSLGYFLKTSKKAGIDTTTFGAGETFEGWGDKYIYVREMLEDISDDTLVIVSDARDVLLNVPDKASADVIVPHFISSFERLTKNSPDAVVMSAESQCCVSAMTQAAPLDYFDPITGKRNVRACASGEETCPYEDGYNVNAWKAFMCELSYQRTGSYHHSVFLNAGLFAGSARNILRLLDRVDIGEKEDDQAVMSGLLYHDPEAVVLDYENELFGVAEWPKGLEDGCIFSKTAKTF